MKTKQPSSSFNLPVLLSFNELAWIAIFGMALACAYAWRRLDDMAKLQEKLSQSQAIIDTFASTTNSIDPARLAEELSRLRRDNSNLFSELSAQRAETLRFSNLWHQSQGTNAASAFDLARIRAVNQSLSNKIVQLEADNQRLTELLDQSERTNRWLVGQMQTANRQIADLSNQVAQLSKRRGEGEIRQELLSLNRGLTNRGLSNVVILLDHSGSMDTGKGREKGQRWRDATNVVNTWLSHLPIKNCALVLFSDRPKPFPEDGSWLRINETNRGALVAQLNGLRPEGQTDTPAALRTAYSYPNVDTIILFTDGKPERGESSDPKNRGRDSGRGSQTMMNDVLNLCTNRQPRIPVNTVGIGDYFDNDLGKFLRQLAAHTGGTFIGR